MEQTGGESSSNAVVTVEGGILMSKQRRSPFKGIRIQNPFTFKVDQVFTGFGIGYGVGIGVGRPINMGAIPVVNQVMGATRGATDAFSGVTGHLNNAVGSLQSENNMLQMVLKHPRIIEELQEENEKLREILIEDLKVPPGKISGSHSSKHRSPCTDCFEWRRKQRRK